MTKQAYEYILFVLIYSLARVLKQVTRSRRRLHRRTPRAFLECWKEFSNLTLNYNLNLSFEFKVIIMFVMILGFQRQLRVVRIEKELRCTLNELKRSSQGKLDGVGEPRAMGNPGTSSEVHRRVWGSLAGASCQAPIQQICLTFLLVFSP